MEITSQIEGNSCVMILSGDLDVHSASSVEEAIRSSFEKYDKVTVDISRVPFADSSGLGVLISAYKFAMEKGKEIRLRKPTPIVSEILTITRMKRFFPIEE